MKKRVIDQDESTRFIVPDLSNHSSEGGSVPYDFASFMLPVLSSRSKELPSLDPLTLTVFNRWKLPKKARESWAMEIAGAIPISSRMRALLADVAEKRKEDPFAKFLVFSKYKESLHAVRDMLASINVHEEGQHGTPFKSVMVDSSSGSQAKEYSLSAFNEDPECNFCLLHTPSCGTGLTLTIASCLYMLEPEENAALEAQVISRVHRIGQLKNVRCVVFYGKRTWEERLLHHRQSEGKLTEVLADPDALSVLSAGNDEQKRDAKKPVAAKDQKWSGPQLKMLLAATPAREERKKNTAALAAKATAKAGEGGGYADFGRAMEIFGANSGSAYASSSSSSGGAAYQPPPRPAVVNRGPAYRRQPGQGHAAVNRAVAGYRRFQHGLLALHNAGMELDEDDSNDSDFDSDAVSEEPDEEVLGFYGLMPPFGAAAAARPNHPALVRVVPSPPRAQAVALPVRAAPVPAPVVYHMEKNGEGRDIIVID